MPDANAAFRFHPSAIKGEGGKLMGMHAANEGFVHAFARHAEVDRFYCVIDEKVHGDAFAQVVRSHRNDATVHAIDRRNTAGLAEPGCGFWMDPQIAALAWRRRAIDPRAFSICGLTHTISSDGVMRALGDLMLAPMEPWDALVCTSDAVRKAVETQFDALADYLRDRFDAKRNAKPRLEVIPLGVDCDRLAPNPASRASWRTKLGIADDDVAALFVGRLSFHAKANPYPMYVALERAARSTGKRLHLIQAGWFANQVIEAAFRDGAHEHAPSVVAHFLDGRAEDVRRAIWSAGDLFVSLVDNVQETFGLAPVEAMAAGLPAVVSDWNGYKDTVRDGIDGFRVPTAMAPAGAGEALAARLLAGIDSYDRFIGAASQAIAVDIDAAAQALERLIADATLRKRLAAAARERAQGVFDWRQVVRRYQALWSELARERRAGTQAPTQRRSAVNPWLMDPFRMFQNYASAPIADGHRLSLAPDAGHRLRAMLRSGLAAHCAETLPNQDEFAAMVDAIGRDRAPTAQTALAAMPRERRDAAWRGVLWLVKYGIARISQPR
jgi:glycosyltransferase involved in cell wall biosynthesis